MISPREQQLISLLGDPSTREKGFQRLLVDYQERVYSIVRRMVISHTEADDIVQDTFVKVWENLESFRFESSLYTWIYWIAVNESLKYLRHKRRKLFLPLVNVEEQLANLIDNPLHFNGTQMEARLQKAVLKLPPKQRLVFNMKYFENHTYEEMSEILGTSVGALKASYHLAIKKLEHYLDSY